MRRRLVTALLAAIGLSVGVLAVGALREATMSTHQPIHRDSTIRLELTARTRGAEANQTLAEMVEAQILTCRLEVTSDVVGPIVATGERTFSAVLQPSMDETNRRQFRGCIEDFSIDHVQLEVTTLTDQGVLDASI